MCKTCGCGNPDEFKIQDHNHDHIHEYEHHFDPDYEHTHEHEHNGNKHTHSHTHPEKKMINLEKDVLSENNKLAERNRGYFAGRTVRRDPPVSFRREARGSIPRGGGRRGSPARTCYACYRLIYQVFCRGCDPGLRPAPSPTPPLVRQGCRGQARLSRTRYRRLEARPCTPGPGRRRQRGGSRSRPVSHGSTGRGATQDATIVASCGARFAATTGGAHSYRAKALATYTAI